MWFFSRIVCNISFKFQGDAEENKAARFFGSSSQKYFGPNKIRTYVDFRQWIYNPPPLTTRASTLKRNTISLGGDSSSPFSGL